MSKDHLKILVIVCLLSIVISMIVYWKGRIWLMYTAEDEFDSYDDWWGNHIHEAWYGYTEFEPAWILIAISVYSSLVWSIFYKISGKKKDLPKILALIVFGIGVIYLTCYFTAPPQKGKYEVISGSGIVTKSEERIRTPNQFPQLYLVGLPEWVVWFILTISFLQPLYSIPFYVAYRFYKSPKRVYKKMERLENRVVKEYFQEILACRQILDPKLPHVTNLRTLIQKKFGKPPYGFDYELVSSRLEKVLNDVADVIESFGKIHLRPSEKSYNDAVFELNKFKSAGLKINTPEELRNCINFLLENGKIEGYFTREYFLTKRHIRSKIIKALE